MIQHLLTDPKKPARVVILGGSGFLGRYLVQNLQTRGISSLSLSSREVDLTEPQSVDKLNNIVKPEDVVLFASCLTPDRGRDIRTMMRNLAMGEHVCATLATVPCAHVIYISSDAVYADSETLVREDSRCEPSSLYGLGHFTRERMIRDTATAAKIPWLVVRPTLLYGPGDTHGSYGPNRFYRQIADNGVIKIFGNGEEQRDHVFIGDVAKLLGQCIVQRTTGIMNLATGKSSSFGEVAEMCQKYSSPPAKLEKLPRSGGTITHRHFDISNLFRAFPEFRFTPLDQGVRIYLQKRAVA